MIGLGIVLLIIYYSCRISGEKIKKDMEETKSESEEKNTEEKVIPLESKRSEEPTNEKQEEAQPETAKEYESVQKIREHPDRVRAESKVR